MYNPAFPCSLKYESGDYSPYFDHVVSPGSVEILNFSGISIHQYFMAHAPAEPQPWFDPVMPEPRPEDRWADKSAPDGPYFDIRKAALHYKSKTLYAENLRNYAEDAQNQWDEKWKNEFAKQRYLQWPAAWADEMVKREKMR